MTTRVPAIADMDDDTLHKHISLRHLPAGDWAGLKSIRGGEAFTANRKTYASWHDYCHQNWTYSHDHG